MLYVEMEVNIKEELTELKIDACEARIMGGEWKKKITIHKKPYGIIILF